MLHFSNITSTKNRVIYNCRQTLINMLTKTKFHSPNIVQTPEKYLETKTDRVIDETNDFYL